MGNLWISTWRVPDQPAAWVRADQIVCVRVEKVSGSAPRGSADVIAELAAPSGQWWEDGDGKMGRDRAILARVTTLDGAETIARRILSALLNYADDAFVVEVDKKGDIAVHDPDSLVSEGE
ncbi:hypothetical protein ACWDO0_27860 [Nocardia rhamnosiphila]